MSSFGLKRCLQGLLILLLGLIAGDVWATDLLPARSVVMVEQGKFRISAPHASASQTLGVWLRQSLTRLETLWGGEVPFQAEQPLEVFVIEDLEQVQLWERWQGGVLRQRIGIPEDPSKQDPLLMADALTRALSHRGLLAANQGEWVSAPEWWVRGHSIELLNGGADAALASWVEARNWQWTFPEIQAVKPDPETVTLVNRAEELLLCRWIRHQSEGTSWAWLAAWDPTQPAVHFQKLTRSSDLRDLHINWVLWTEADRDALCSEYRLASGVIQQLETRARIHPAQLGVSGLPVRYRSMDLEEFSRYAEVEGAEELLTRWSIQLQPLAFRQSEEVHAVVKGYLDAGLLLQQVAEGNPKALELFSAKFNEARKAHHALLLGLPSGSN